MVSRQNLELLCTLIRETNEVLDDIQQARLFKDTLKEVTSCMGSLQSVRISCGRSRFTLRVAHI